MDIIWCKDLQDDQKDIVLVDGAEKWKYYLLYYTRSGDDAQQDERELGR